MRLRPSFVLSAILSLSLWPKSSLLVQVIAFIAWIVKATIFLIFVWWINLLFFKSNIMRTFETGCDWETCFDLQQNAAVRIFQHFVSVSGIDGGDGGRTQLQMLLLQRNCLVVAQEVQLRLTGLRATGYTRYKSCRRGPKDTTAGKVYSSSLQEFCKLADWRRQEIRLGEEGKGCKRRETEDSSNCFRIKSPDNYTTVTSLSSNWLILFLDQLFVLKYGNKE